MKRFSSSLLVPLVLAGCMSQPPAPTVERQGNVPPARTTAAPVTAQAAAVPTVGQYVVKRGDTLYRIALENGQDYRDIAAWNGITAPFLIKEGQSLRVQPPGTADGPVVARPVSTTPTVEARPLDAPPVAASGPIEGLRREPRAGKEPYSDEAYARLNRQEGQSARPAPAEPARSEAPAAAAGGDEPVWSWPSSGKVVAPFNDATNKGLDIAGKAGDAVLAAAEGKVVYAGSGLRGYGELVIVKHNATYLSAYAHNRKILVREGQSVTRGQKIAEMGNSDSDTVKLHFEIRKLGKPTDPMQFLPRK